MKKIFKGGFGVEVKQQFPLKPNCCILSLWTKTDIQLPCLLLICFMGAVVKIPFSALILVLWRTSSPLWLGWLGGIQRLSRATQPVEMWFSKIFSFALTQNILFSEKLSSAPHPKLDEKKVLK